MARRAAADRNPRGGSARPPARGPLRTPRGVRPSVAHALTFGEGVSHGDLATGLSADSAEPAPSVAGPERLTGAHRATRTLPVFPFGGSHAGIRRDSAFQSAVPPRSFRLRVSGAVAPSAPAPGGTGLSRGDRPAVTAMIGGARPLSTARRGGRGRLVTPASSPPTLYCLQRHLGAGPRDTAGAWCASRNRFDLQRHLGAGPRDTPVIRRVMPTVIALQRHLGAGPRDTRPDGLQGDTGPYPSTSPRHLAEGYRHDPPQRLDRGVQPSTSPRHWAEGYFFAASIFSLVFFCLQRHLGAGPRDTPLTAPRDSSPDIFNITSALGRGIRRSATRLETPSSPFNVTSALGRGIRYRTHPNRIDDDYLQRHLDAEPRDTWR